MVGVPRSQGCRHCRRKKKGCDLQRPSCGQCLRLGLDCSYASKKWTFVQTDHSRIPIRSRSVPDMKERKSRSASPPTGTVEQSLYRRSAETRLLTEFWDNFLPVGEKPRIGRVAAAYWSGVVRDLAIFDSAVNACASACASMSLGRHHNDMQLLREGTRLYSKALRETNLALQDPKRAQRDETLACIKLLSLYEAFRYDPTPGVTTQANDWHAHIEGTCKIVELRGPHKHIAHHGHLLFEEARLLAIISGIVLRKPNYFTGPSWHTIPWETHSRDVKDELLDIMIVLPDILYNQDLISASLEDLSTPNLLFSAITTAQTHLNRCILIATALQEWEQRALAACLALDPIYSSSRRTSDNFIGPLTLLEICKDFNYGFFHLINIYWTACTILYSSMWILKRNVLLATTAALNTQTSSPNSPDSTDPTPQTLPALLQLPQIPAHCTPRIPASNIAHTAHHYFLPAAGFWGPWNGTFPIGAAAQYYAATGAHDCAEMRMIREVLQKPNFGRPAAEFLRSMANSAATVGTGVEGRKVKKGGDTMDRKSHSSMAGNWYGIDAVEGERKGGG